MEQKKEKKKKGDLIVKPKTELVETSSTSPVQIIEKAISGGADLEKLKGLMELQERWEGNEARKEYNISMAEFKANPPKIIKDMHVRYKTKAGQIIEYDHASLANICNAISSELSKYGLSASWRTKQNGNIFVTCKINHIKGHSEETTLSSGADTSGYKNSIQAMASTITYLERYTLLALTGLATYDQDDDGIKSEEPQEPQKPKEDIVKPGKLEPVKKDDKPGAIDTAKKEPLKEELKPEEPTKPKEEKKVSGLSMNQRFKDALKVLGTEKYYKVLATHGYTTISAIKGKAVAEKVLEDLEKAMDFENEVSDAYKDKAI